MSAGGDIFKDGASPELERNLAVEELREAVTPPACTECGHVPSPTCYDRVAAGRLLASLGYSAEARDYAIRLVFGA